MQIRKADKFDFPVIFKMLKNFREHAPVTRIKECKVDEQYANSLVMSLLAGRGVVLLAVKDDQICGMIMGGIDQNVWDPTIRVLRELVFWVEEDSRGTTAGYRLIKEYNKVAEELKEEERIHMYTMTKMVNSPDLKFEKFGYEKIEEVWVA